MIHLTPYASTPTEKINKIAKFGYTWLSIGKKYFWKTNGVPFDNIVPPKIQMVPQFSNLFQLLID